MKEGIKKWHQQAKADFSTANANLKSKKYYAAVLFCQQAAEKGLKALWLKEKGTIPYIHDLTLLGKELDAPKDFFTTFKELTSSYTETRYPDSSDLIPSKKFSKSDATNYIKKTKSIMAWLKNKI